MEDGGYVHGYSRREGSRLDDQANVLAELLHHDTFYEPGSTVLEAGCGVGAQTAILAERSPGAAITAIDVSTESLREAEARVQARGCGSNVSFLVADVHDPPFERDSFDHVFVCFLLEHLSKPLEALASLRDVLRDGGSVTVIEGDHGSAFFHPDSTYARRAVAGLVESQARLGGDALIGRRLYPLMCEAGFREVQVSPRVVYADASRPEMVEGFTRNTFSAMVEGARPEVLRAGLMTAEEFDRGVGDLYRTAGPDGTFNYTFFKAVGLK